MDNVISLPVFGSPNSAELTPDTLKALLIDSGMDKEIVNQIFTLDTIKSMKIRIFDIHE